MLYRSLITRLILLIITASTTHTQPLDSLSLFKETGHINLYCTPRDQSTALLLLQESSDLLDQLSHDFKHHYSRSITIAIYPDIAALHAAIEDPDSPDWVVGKTAAHMSMIVSPENPGPHHSYLSIFRINQINFIALFIADKYKGNQIPTWLSSGVALYKASWHSDKKNALFVGTIPTMEQLETITDNDYTVFDQLNGWYIAPSIIEFMVHRWGWKSVLQLLEKYDQFETIFGVSKEEFHHNWITFVLHPDSNNTV